MLCVVIIDLVNYSQSVIAGSTVDRSWRKYCCNEDNSREDRAVVGYGDATQPFACTFSASRAKDCQKELYAGRSSHPCRVDGLFLLYEASKDPANERTVSSVGSHYSANFHRKGMPACKMHIHPLPDSYCGASQQLHRKSGPCHTWRLGARTTVTCEVHRLTRLTGGPLSTRQTRSCWDCPRVSSSRSVGQSLTATFNTRVQENR